MLIMSDEIKLEKHDMINMWSKMFPVSKMNMCCYNLTLLDKLDYIFDVLSRIHDLGFHRQEKFSELIIQGFIEALNSKKFLIACKILAQFAFILEENS